VSPVDHTTDLIKRIVAVAGDTVELRNKKLYVNGEQVMDPHAYFEDPQINTSGPRDNFGPMTVPAGKFFVLGDNRDKSYDSRFWGFANVSDVKGKATFIYWSWDSQRKWPRFERLGHFIT
jgi:signal peptidase I